MESVSGLELRERDGPFLGSLVAVSSETSGCLKRDPVNRVKWQRPSAQSTRESSSLHEVDHAHSDLEICNERIRTAYQLVLGEAIAACVDEILGAHLTWTIVDTEPRAASTEQRLWLTTSNC